MHSNCLIKIITNRSDFLTFNLYLCKVIDDFCYILKCSTKVS